MKTMPIEKRSMVKVPFLLAFISFQACLMSSDQLISWNTIRLLSGSADRKKPAYLRVAVRLWFPSIKTRPGETPSAFISGKSSSNGPVNILIFESPASLKFAEATAEVCGQPSIVYTFDPGQAAARYIVLIPSEVPNSRTY